MVLIGNDGLFVLLQAQPLCFFLGSGRRRLECLPRWLSVFFVQRSHKGKSEDFLISDIDSVFAVVSHGINSVPGDEVDVCQSPFPVLQHRGWINLVVPFRYGLFVIRLSTCVQNAQ